jgi:phosphoserine phosphatase RsbU/P
MEQPPTDLDAQLGRTLRGFLDAVHDIRPGNLPDLVEQAGVELGATSTQIWMVDHQQRVLAPLGRPGSECIPLEGTLPGRCFITCSITEGHRAESHRAEGTTQLWLPLQNGVDRIGVLEVGYHAPGEAARAALEALASITAAELVSRGQYTDLFTVTRRQRELSLAAELQWQLLPPPSFTTPDVAIAGMLEPAYDVGGDSFDYASSDGRLVFAVFDAVGHGLASSLISTLAVGAYRNARRCGNDLAAVIEAIDAAITAQFPDFRYATALVAELDVETGELRWINAGHPPPLLLRSGRVIGTLDCRPRVPLGLGWLLPTPVEVGQTQLEPGDALLLYTDGVVEAKRSQGVDFGLERLEELLHKAAAAELAPAETVRRLTGAVMDHHGGELHDDATTLLMCWQPALSNGT